MGLQNINELVAEIRAEAVINARRTAADILEDAEKTVAKVEKNRLAYMMLVEAGILVTWHGNRSTSIELGFFAKTAKGNADLAEAVAAIRKALGCRLENTGKDVDDHKKRTVRFEMRPVEFKMVSIHFTRKLPKDAKCRIVRSRSSYSSLVCDV